MGTYGWATGGYDFGIDFLIVELDTLTVIDMVWSKILDELAVFAKN